VSGPCPWCGRSVEMHGYQIPVEHECSFDLVCGATTGTTTPDGAWYARLGRCRNPQSQPDGRCYHHTASRGRAWPLGEPQPQPISMTLTMQHAVILRSAATAAGVSPVAMVRLLIENHLTGPR
jgi:hypothetical protein